MFSISIHAVGFHFKHFIINKHHFPTFKKVSAKFPKAFVHRQYGECGCHYLILGALITESGAAPPTKETLFVFVAEAPKDGNSL